MCVPFCDVKQRHGSIGCDLNYIENLAGGYSSIPQAKADFDGRLKMRNPAILNVAPQFRNLEPAHAFHRLTGLGDGIADGFFHGFRGTAHDFDFLVYVIFHERDLSVVKSEEDFPLSVLVRGKFLVESLPTLLGQAFLDCGCQVFEEFFHLRSRNLLGHLPIKIRQGRIEFPNPFHDFIRRGLDREAVGMQNLLDLFGGHVLHPRFQHDGVAFFLIFAEGIVHFLFAVANGTQQKLRPRVCCVGIRRLHFHAKTAMEFPHGFEDLFNLLVGHDCHPNSAVRETEERNFPSVGKSKCRIHAVDVPRTRTRKSLGNFQKLCRIIGRSARSGNSRSIQRHKTRTGFSSIDFPSESLGNLLRTAWKAREPICGLRSNPEPDRVQYPPAFDREFASLETACRMPTLLVIDDDRSIRRMVRGAFDETPPIIDVLEAGTAKEGLESLRRHCPDVVLLDIFLPRESGLHVFHQIVGFDSRVPVIFITADTESETAIDAMMLGAFDYLIKPLDLKSLASLVKRAIETRRMMQTPVKIPLLSEVSPPDQLVGQSLHMLDVYKAVGRVSPQNVTVLIRGESGTGKELVARAIYQHSPRKESTFLAVNCAAIPDALLESELFGHEKGAFTGADRRRIGKFEQCHRGTIFLDEIGDMSPVTQGKILRLLQQQEFERVGGNQTIRTDVRIIAATNRDLESLVSAGDYREDLYYRLNGFTIKLPPLRERGNDVIHLLEYFLGRLGHDLNRQHVEGISSDAVELLMNYPWPGNVRELQSVVRQALLNVTGPVIVPDCLPKEIRAASKPEGWSSDSTEFHPPAIFAGLPSSNLAPLVEEALQRGTRNLYATVLQQMERYVFTRVLKETRGNQSQAAEILGVGRGKVADRIHSFGIQLEQEVRLNDGSDAS